MFEKACWFHFSKSVRVEGYKKSTEKAKADGKAGNETVLFQSEQGDFSNALESYNRPKCCIKMPNKCAG